MSFEAKYHGRCQGCSGLIEPGDQVEYDTDDALVHVQCDEQADLDAPSLHERHCPDCWTHHAGGCL
jgi:hypothetical protein